jgi:hypothetical protein
LNNAQLLKRIFERETLLEDSGRATISSGINGRVFRREHPKTDAGIREVPINDLVRPILILCYDYLLSKKRHDSLR